MSATQSRQSVVTEQERTVPAIDLKIERFRLKCGATLLVSPRQGASVSAVQMHMRGGVSLDPSGLEGTAYLTGALLEQGTQAHSEEELVTLLETSGGSVSGDAHGVAGAIAAPSTDLLLELMCEMITRPTFPKKQVDRQKQRLLDRLLIERDDPRSQAEQRFRKLVYGAHWLGRAAHGTVESVGRIDSSTLRAFHKRWYMPQRAVFAVCGDFEPKAIQARLDRLLSAWKSGVDDPAPKAEYPTRAPRVQAFHAKRQQVHVYLGHLGVRRNDPDYPALVVMDHVLGTGPGFTNRIARRLRDEQGLAYTVTANIHGSAGIHPGMFTAYIGTSPENVGTAIDGFLSEIRRIQDEPVADAELELARSYVTGSFALSFQRAARRANYMISHERHGFPPDHLTRIVQQFAAVNHADIQRVAKAHLHPEACCISAAGPITAAELAAHVGSGAAVTQPTAGSRASSKSFSKPKFRAKGQVKRKPAASQRKQSKSRS